MSAESVLAPQTSGGIFMREKEICRGKISNWYGD